MFNKICICLLVSLLFCPEVRAANSVYTVDVSVDVTAENAAIAREKAMQAANRKAFETVVRKITTSQGASVLSALDDNQILNFIKEVSVVSEKTSSVRYMADLKVAINDAILKAYLDEKEIGTVVEDTSRIMVVPLFREFDSDEPVLWGEGNLWRKAWMNKEPRNSLVQIFSIPESGANYALIDARKAEEFNQNALELLMRENEARDVYVLDAVYDGIEGLKIKVSSFRNGENAYETLKISGDRSQPDELFRRAVNEVSSKIENGIKTASVVESQQAEEIVVVYAYGSLREWLSVESQLRDVPYIKKLFVDAMGNNKVQFRLNFVGSIDNLQNSLNARFLTLKEYDGFFALNRI